MSTEPQSNNKRPGTPKRPKLSTYWLYAVVILVALFIYRSGDLFNLGFSKSISISQFETELLEKNLVDSINIVSNRKTVEVFVKKDSLQKLNEGKSSDEKLLERGPQYTFKIGDIQNFENTIKTYEENLNTQNESDQATQYVKVNYSEADDFFGNLMQIVLSMAIFVGIWLLLMRRMGTGGGGGAGGGIFSIGKSKAQLFDKGKKVNVTFSDVAGLDEAKVEVMEIVDFLKQPKKYTSLGGKIPKGALLVGPPGTGKTLLAKAVAGEAQVPFFSLSGSDFVEMFVGVGASRVRDLFKQAREKAPCIIFIDEIDAIGRARGKNAMMSNDERENTLNQLLVEMDGFADDAGIILLAATNRPDVLDTALLRPGRFDRQISIDIPDQKGRAQIFKVHLKNIKTVKDIDRQKLASQTPGFAGADIANVCNEAALIAARNGKTLVDMDDFNDAIDRVIGGLEKKNKIISPEEKKVIAYHEAGHAVVGWFLEYAHPLVKVTIIPRGVAALGYAQYLPKEKYLTIQEELMDNMSMSLGGRVAEEIFFNKVSTGALSDLQSVTKIAYAMVTVYGMSPKIGNISFHDPKNDGSFQKPYSEETGKMIDDEVRQIVEVSLKRTRDLLQKHKKDVEIIAEELLEKEVIYKEDVERLIGKRPFTEVIEIDPVETIEVVEDFREPQNSDITSSNGSSENDGKSEGSTDKEAEDRKTSV